jgi:hypothetical protein
VSAQDIAVTLLAALALAWLLARRWRTRRRVGAAGAACAHCPAATPVAGVRPAPEPVLLLVIGEPAPPADSRKP